MIRHKGIGVDLGPGGPRLLLEPVQKVQIVVFSEKTGLPVVTALDDVQWRPGQDESMAARHFRSPVGLTSSKLSNRITD